MGLVKNWFRSHRPEPVREDDYEWVAKHLFAMHEGNQLRKDSTMPDITELPAAMLAKIDAVKAWVPLDNPGGPALGKPYKAVIEWVSYPIPDYILYRMYYYGFLEVVTYINFGVEVVSTSMDKNANHDYQLEHLP